MDRAYSILSSVNSPSDIKNRTVSDLKILADEIRGEIINTVLNNGGHLASNLGTVELGIALHKVFDSPVDKIIWDVGHQCYTHKLLTGRRERFNTIRQMGGISGFPKIIESEHDIINTGHSSTSISVAAGILAGQKMKGTEGKVIAVIGDGALTGGMALEALNFSGSMPDDLIIILNDNEMSISRNVGAISTHLTAVTTSRGYQFFRRTFDRTLTSLPFVGKPSMEMVRKFKKAFKAFFYKKTIFSDMGYQYIGPVNGHNIKNLIKVLEKIKKLKGPVLLHVITQKGRGYSEAETNPSFFHGVKPDKKTFSDSGEKIFTHIFSEYLLEKGEHDKNIAVVTAAMADGTGLSPFAERFPERFFDAGIAEQHALTFGASLGLTGIKPVVALYSTFLQRAVDQVIHDIALSNLPVTVMLDRAGLVGGDGETHQGVFDIPLLRAVPGITILSPACATELKSMMDYSLSSKKPVFIRYPKAVCPHTYPGLEAEFCPGTGCFGKKTGSRILLVSTGSIYSEIVKASELLEESGVNSDTYNLRTIKPVDKKRLTDDWGLYKHIFIIEDCAVNGGISEFLYRVVSEKLPDKDCFIRGIPDSFISHGTRNEIMKECLIDCISICFWVIKQLNINSAIQMRKASSLY